MSEVLLILGLLFNQSSAYLGSQDMQGTDMSVDILPHRQGQTRQRHRRSVEQDHQGAVVTRVPAPEGETFSPCLATSAPLSSGARQMQSLNSPTLTKQPSRSKTLHHGSLRKRKKGTELSPCHYSRIVIAATTMQPTHDASPFPKADHYRFGT